jgi:predicted neutral ceramidase superfamily lipid hydrolase
MKEKWYKRNIKVFLNKNIEVIIASFLAPVIIFFWYYYAWWIWEWENLEVVKFTMLSYGLVSALTFIWPWRILHDLYLYRVLYWISPTYNDFTKAKGKLWLILNFITAWAFIFIVNFLATILYNLYTFTVYLLPSFIIVASIIWVYYWYLYLKNKKQLFKS